MRIGIILLVAFLTLLLLSIPYMLFAQVMQGTTYKMSSDTINIGGQSSASAVYKLGDTLGELGTGNSNSAEYMHAGFWQLQESYIAITSPTDLVLASIGGINAQTSEGVLSWQITTDNAAGYTMSIKTNTVPALKSALDSFADYTPSGADPDYNFSVSPATSAFGFSPEGADTNARFKDNGSVCDTGGGEVSGKCWDGLSTSYKAIAGRTTSNHPGGSIVNVRFRAASGAGHIQTSGSYSASIVVTAVAL